MPRLNIEPSIWSDPRFQNLLIKTGDRIIAKGMITELWVVAQEYWIPDKKLIPKKVFDSLGLSVLIDVGLAEDLGEEIYAKGAKENFQWWFEKVEAGRTGGRISAQRPRDNAGRLLPKQTPSTAQAETKHIQPSSSSSSLKKNTCSLRSLFDLESIYSVYPRKVGKSVGLKRLSGSVSSVEEFNDLVKAVENYRREVAGRETRHIKHFSSWASEWRDWVGATVEKEKILTLEDLQAL